MTDASTKQKEYFSRAWIVTAAASADFSYSIVADDDRGVDMTVHSGKHTLDFQLKATSHPKYEDDHVIFDLDVRTYDLLRTNYRSGYGVLALVVVGSDPTAWQSMDEFATRIEHSAYFLPLCGLPESSNTTSVRLRLPRANLLTADAMRTLMAAEAARWDRA